MKRRLEEFLQMYTLEVEDIGLEHHDLKESLPRDSLSGSMPVFLGCIPQRLGACICFSLFRFTTKTHQRRQGYDVFSITQRGMGKAKPALNCANSKLPESCPAGGCQVVRWLWGVGTFSDWIIPITPSRATKLRKMMCGTRCSCLICSIIAHSSC